jgi:hypothetical protein
MREFHSKAVIQELHLQLKAERSRTSSFYPILFYCGGASLLIWASAILFNGIPHETLRAFPAVAGLACLLAGYHFRSAAHRQWDHERRLASLLEKAGITSSL